MARQRKVRPDEEREFPVMLAPPLIRGAYALAGVVHLYHEHVPVDKQGRAYPKSQAAVAGLRTRKFVEVADAVSE